MSNLTVSSKTTPYSAGGTNGTSSSTTVSRSSSSTTISNKVSSTTPNTTGVTASTTTVTKTTGAVTSSTTTAYGASNTNSVVRFISSSTTVSRNVSSTTPSVSSSTTVRSNVSSTTPSVSSGTPKVESEKLQLPKFEDFLGSEGLDILNKAIAFLNGDGGKYDDYFVFDTVVIENDIFNHNLKEYQTRESINNVFDKINEDLRTDIINKINGALEGIIQVTDKYNLFTEEINTGSIKLKYYGDLDRTNDEGCVEIEVEKTVSETMDRFFDVENLVVSLKGKNTSLEVVEGEAWFAYSDEDETFKINMTKMPMGILDVAYEKTTPLLRDGKNSMNFTVGLELEARVDMDFMEPVQEVCMEKITEKSLEEMYEERARDNRYTEDVKLDEFLWTIGGFLLYVGRCLLGSAFPMPAYSMP